MVDVVAFTELVCEGQAGQVLQPVPVDRVNVKPNDERGEQPGVDHHRDGDEDALPVLVEVPEGDVGQEGEGEQQAAEETEDVGDVVDPRQEAAQEEEEDDAQQLEEGFPRLLQDLPTLKQLDKQAGEESKLRPRWTHLSSVGQEQGGGEVSSDTAEDIDDGDADPTSQLLQVSQYGHLEHHRHQAVQQPSMEEEREPETVELVRNIGVEERQQAAHVIQTVDL